MTNKKMMLMHLQAIQQRQRNLHELADGQESESDPTVARSLRHKDKERNKQYFETMHSGLTHPIAFQSAAEKFIGTGQEDPLEPGVESTRLQIAKNSSSFFKDRDGKPILGWIDPLRPVEPQNMVSSAKSNLRVREVNPESEGERIAIDPNADVRERIRGDYVLPRKAAEREQERRDFNNGLINQMEKDGTQLPHGLNLKQFLNTPEGQQMVNRARENGFIQ